MSSQRVIVVDDNDSRINYVGQGWVQDNGSQDPYGNYGPTYKHTLHGTSVSNSISFSFKGTSVTVMGTTNAVKIDDTHHDPTWECFVDNVSIGATTPFYSRENNWVMCSKGGLIDGQHELSIKITITNGHTFWLDSIQFAPSPSDTYDTEVLLVKNEDPGIEWSSGWGKLGSATFTGAHGSTARMNFVGTGLTWVGWVPKELPHAASSGTYSIDGGDPVSFPLNGLSSTTSITLYGQTFFTTPQLPAGPHSILVTYEGDGSHTPLTLDFIYLTNKTMPASASSPPPISSGGGASTGTSTSTNSHSTKDVGTSSFISGSPTGTAGGSTPSSPGAFNPDPSGTTTSSSSSKTPIGPIVGGVVGGIVLLALIAALLYCLRRRSRERREIILPATGNEMSPFTGGYAPSQIPTFKTTTERSYIPVPQAPSSVGSYEPYAGYVSALSSNASNSGRPGHQPSGSMSSSSAPSLQPLRKGQEARAEAPLPVHGVVRHEDSGVRIRNQAPRIVEEIPPMYTAS